MDTIVISESDHPVIRKRVFTVVNVFMPELFKPVPYPKILPPAAEYLSYSLFPTEPILMNSARDTALDDFTSSLLVIQTVRSSQKKMAFLVALSALFASLQPIVDNFSKTVGWVFTALGVISALISVVLVLLGYAIERFEVNSATRRLRQAAVITN